MREPRPVVQRKAQLHRFLVQRQRALAAAQVALDLAQALERMHQVGVVAVAARSHYRLAEVLQRILEAILAAGDVAALDQGVGVLAHAGASTSSRRVMNRL